MKTMKKIVAILAVTLMLCSILPLSVFAAEDVTINTYAQTGTLGGTTSISWESGDYQVVSYKNTSTTAIRTSDADHFRYYVGNKLVISGKDGALMSKVVITCTGSSYMLNNTSNTLGAGWTVSASGTTLTYTPDGGSASELTITIGKQSRSSKIVITPAAAAEPEEPSTCEHEWSEATCTTPKTCSACGETEGEALGHDWEIISEEDATCTADGSTTYECAACGEDKVETIPALPHNYVDGFCSACGEAQPLEVTINTFANTGVLGDKVISWTNGDFSVVNKKGSSSNDIRTSDTDHFRLYVGNTFTVSGGAMTTVVINCVSGYPINDSTNKVNDGWTVTANGTAITYTATNGSADELTITIGKQSRVKSVIITPYVAAESDCEHINAKACDKYCPDCSTLINEDAAHKSNAQYPCYEGKCEYCDEVIAAEDHVLNADDICTICGLAPTPEKPVDPENPQEYVFSDFVAGTQYAENEKHYLDNAVTVITNKGHFTTELRIYSSSTNNATVVIKSTKAISAIVLNAGYKADVLNLYVSENGEIFEAIEIANTAYSDYTVLIPEMTNYIKLDVQGTQQVRIQKMTLYFDGEEPAPTECTDHSYTGDYDTSCNVCGTEREVTFPAADSKLTIEETMDLVAGMDNGATTPDSYKVSGTITKIDDTYYDITIEDENGNIFLAYGSNYNTLSTKPSVGDVVTLYGQIKNYQNTPEIEKAQVLYMPATPEGIVDALYNLPENGVLPEDGTLTGYIYEVEEAYNIEYNNITVWMYVYDSNNNLITDKPVYCYRIKGDGVDQITVGDIITVSGKLTHYTSNKYEFDKAALIAYKKHDHTYAHDFDTDCDVCGTVRAVAGPVSFIGKSVSEDCSGLAFLFNVEATGFAIKAGTFVQADYTNATYNGYKLLEVGVTASNGVGDITIKGERMYELAENNATFAFRIIHIPADKLDVTITMTPYYVVEIDGVATTLYGEAQSASYAEVAG